MLSRPSILIEPGRIAGNYWRDLWSYRELLYFLALRDILVKYKQTAIGVAWALLRPALTMAVLSIVFGALARLPSQGVPYPILVLSGTLPWLFFAEALADTGTSLLTNASMISKVYFPRLLVPAGAIVVSLVDFAIAAVLLALLMAWYGFAPDWRILALPFFVAMAAATALGAGLLIAALNVRYRDFRYVLPFVLQFGLFVSPVGYSSSIIPEPWRLAYYLNPMAGVIDGFRWSILAGHSALHVPGLIISCAVSLLLLICGVAYFRRTERTFADVI
jgi:lipopolysaccharide transport system permease protein